jgi:5'-methylthioadenosine phosphorylase
MTQYPEAYLARELEMCYVNISLITDYDVGVAGEDAAVTHEEVLRVFTDNNEKLRKLLFDIVPRIPEQRSCSCGTALQGARLEV